MSENDKQEEQSPPKSEGPKEEAEGSSPQQKDNYELNKIKIKKSEEQNRLAKRARNSK